MLIEWTTLAGTYLANNVFIDYTLVASPPHTQHKSTYSNLYAGILFVMRNAAGSVGIICEFKAEI